MRKSLVLPALVAFMASNLAHAAIPTILPAHAVADPAPGNDHGAYSVHFDTVSIPDPFAAKAYDNFRLTMDTLVNGINWHGIYSEPIPNPASNVDFLIEFWGDANGVPDIADLKHSFFLLHGPASSTPGTTGDVTRSTPDNGDHLSPTTHTTFGGGPAVQYDAQLPETLLEAGDYWLSIQAVQRFDSVDAFDPEWQWHVGESSNPDGFFAADLSLNPGAGIVGVRVADSGDPKDLAFELMGAVPEPSSVFLSVIGAFGILGFARRRR